MKAKRIVLIYILTGILVISLTACSAESSESISDSEEVAEETDEAVDAGSSIAEEIDDEISVQEEVIAQEASLDSEEVSIEFDTSPYVEETVVYESDGITIIATGLTYTDEAVYLDMRMENSSDSEIWINNMFADGWSTESSVNRCKTAQIGFDMDSVAALPGGSATFSIGFSMEELLWCGFTEIADIEAELYLNDSEGIIASASFSISTSAAETYDYDVDAFELNVYSGVMEDYIGYTILAGESGSFDIDGVNCDVLCLLVEESDGSISIIAKLHPESDVTIWMPSCEVNDTEIYRQYASGLSDFLESGKSIVYYYSGSIETLEAQTAVLTFQDLTAGETRTISLGTMSENSEESIATDAGSPTRTETYYIKDGEEILYEYYDYENGRVVEHWYDTSVLSYDGTGTEIIERIEYDEYGNPTCYTYSGESEYTIEYENEYSEGNLLTTINKSIVKGEESMGIVCEIEYENDLPIEYQYYISKSEDAVMMSVEHDNELISSLSISFDDYLWDIEFLYENGLLSSYSVVDSSPLSAVTASTLTNYVFSMDLYDEFSCISYFGDNLYFILTQFDGYGSAEYEYDNSGNLVNTVYPESDTNHNISIEYIYDENGQIISSSQGGVLVTYYTY